VDIGSVHEIAARRFAPKATIIALKARDDCILAVQAGRADCVILAVNLGLTAVKKNPALGEFQMLHQPRVQLPPAWACGWKATGAGAISSMPGSTTIVASSRSANGYTPASRSTVSNPRTSHPM
jgi:hypothetical protein